MAFVCPGSRQYEYLEYALRHQSAISKLDMYLINDDPDGPLDIAEFDALQSVLARVSGGCMSVETVDGYLAGLVCGPTRPSIGICFGPVFGVEVFAEAEFSDATEAAAIERLLWRHWTTISATLETALAEPALRYEPLLFEDDAGRVAANDWARGFETAMRAAAASWQDLETTMPGLLEPVRLLLAEPAPGQGPRYDDARRSELVEGLAALMVAAYRHFDALRA